MTTRFARHLAASTAVALALLSQSASAQIVSPQGMVTASVYDAGGLYPASFMSAGISAATVAIAAGREDGQLTLAGFTAGLTRLMISYARLFADVRYGALEVDTQRGGLTIRDVEVAGFGPTERCHVTLGRLSVNGLALLPAERSNMRFDVADLSIANNCFGANAAAIGVATGGDSIKVQQLTMDLRQVIGSGEVAADFNLVSPGIVRMEGSADFAYLAMVAPGLLSQMIEGTTEDYDDIGYDDSSSDDPMDGGSDDSAMPADSGSSDATAPSIDGPDAAAGSPSDAVDEAAADAQAAAAPDTLPPVGDGSSDGSGDDTGSEMDDVADADEMANPVEQIGMRGTLRSAHLTVEDLGAWERLKPLLPPEVTTPEGIAGLVTAPPGTGMRKLQEGLSEALQAFVAQPGRVTGVIRAAQPITFDTTEWTSPDDAATIFAPSFTTGVPVPPVALIADPAAAGSDPKTMGIALANGAGVPQNIPKAMALLTPLQDDGEVALVLSNLVLPTDPAAAYAHALKAAATGTRGAASALDLAEGMLPTGAVLSAQQPSSTALPDTAFASVESLRDAALGYEEGVGSPRSYALAWRLATLAAAAGDGPAQALMGRLEARFAGDAAWIQARDAAAELASADWTAQGLAARLAAQ